MPKVYDRNRAHASGMSEKFEALYRRFRRLVEKANVIAEARRRLHFEKKSSRKKRAKQAAVKREQKRIMRERIQPSMHSDRRYRVPVDLDKESANDTQAD